MDAPAAPGDGGPRVARLAVSGLTKRFGTLTANDAISFEVAPGELHCLLGENGAGKSTLSACLYGLIAPDTGTIHLDGVPVRFRSPRDAIAAGIGMVHQHFTLVSSFTGFENILVSAPRQNRAAAEARITALAGELGLSLDLARPVGQLSVGEQQWVEILAALFGEARLLILDEPTAVLTPQESAQLFAMIRRLTARGVAVILISHKLDEVLRSDRITVIRRGRVVGSLDAESATRETLASLMVGRAVSLSEARPERPPSPVAMLDIRALTVRGGRTTRALDSLSFTIRRGEILGIAAVAGNGQDELFEALVGLRAAEAGSAILLDGVELTGWTPGAIAAEGVGYVPGDRYRDGLVADFTVAENLLLGHQSNPRFRFGPFLKREAIRAAAEAAVSAYDIRTPSVDARTRTLSGGNAQKVILARELPLASKLLLCNQPTRGLDVGVIEYVRGQILARRAEGCAILLASEDLEDLVRIADRILVLFRGRSMGIIEAAGANLARIGLMMAGEALPTEARATEEAAA
ncbi:ABC transporter ATP-binding protein [Roseococcus sp.]|uniref:ABC transporter ATP-binding protein n=1 Tax=Roseococcus sp. TaxID=2109646 RepID=UPI003BAA5C39